MKHSFMMIALLWAVVSANAQNAPSLSFDPISVTTFAGTGGAGNLGVGFADGPAGTAKFNSPNAVVTIGSDIYVSDAGNFRIRKISANGTVSTFAGNGIAGRVDGTAATAQFVNLGSMAADPLGNLYVYEGSRPDINNLKPAIRKITPAGIVSTVAVFNFVTPGFGITLDAAGNFYLSGGSSIYKLTPAAVLSTFASKSELPSWQPGSLAFDPLGNLYAQQFAFVSPVKISPGGVVTNFPTPAAYWFSMTINKKGDIYALESINPDVSNSPRLFSRYSSTGNRSVLAGGIPAYKDGVGTDAQFSFSARDMAADNAGNIYITDDNRIRKISVPDLHFTTRSGLASGISYFSVSGISLNAAATVQAPAGFELALAAAGPFSTSLNITPVTGEINGVKVYARVAASAVAGIYNDSVVLSYNGAVVQKLAVPAVVNPAGPNQPPVSNGGADVTIALPVSSVTLDGSASSDADGSIAEYYWFQANGPIQSVVGNNFSKVTAATGLTMPGTYTYVLQVTDNAGIHAYSQKVVTVNTGGVVTVPACVTNISPANGSTIATQTTATLTWQASPGATSYDVYFGEGTAAPGLAAGTTGLSYSPQGLTAGRTYSWYVAPRNANGVALGCLTANKTTFTTAAAGNQPTASNGGSDVTITLPTSSITLDGSASTGNIVEYYWFQAQGPVASVVANNFSQVTTATGLTTAGKYIYVLQVIDNNGVHAYSQKVVTVNPAEIITVPCVNQLTPANGSHIATATTATLTWTASANATSYSIVLVAADNSAISVTLPASSGTSHTFTGLTPGTSYMWYIYPGSSNPLDNPCRTSEPFTFITASGNPSASNAGLDTTIILPTSSITLNGSASTGNIAEYYWFQAQGPVASVVGNNFSKVTTATGLTTPGTYVFVLQVIDNNGVHAYSQKSVTVKTAGIRVMDATTLATDLSKTTETSSLPSVTAVISPNPVTTGSHAKLQINSNKAGTVTVNIVSSNGAVIGTKKVNLVAGINSTNVNTYGLAQGFHVIKITGTDKSINLKLLVQ